MFDRLQVRLRELPGREHAQTSKAASNTDLIAFIPTAIASDTGAVQRIADAIADAVGSIGPHALLLGRVILTFALGQLISNVATTLILIPISISAAADLHVSAKPLLMAACLAAAAAFLTPVATPANLMVMELGGYRFGDYWKLGLPLLLFGVVAVLLVPVIWSA